MEIINVIDFVKKMQQDFREMPYETTEEAQTQNLISEVICMEILEALEKQIPKKMKCYEDKYLHCPVCEEPIDFKWEKYPTEMNHFEWLKYCWNCGQAVYWGEEEE